MFTLWYSILSWKEYSDPSSTKCAVKIPEVPEKPIAPPPPKNASPVVTPAPVPSSPVQKSSIPITPKVEPPAPPKLSPVPVPVPAPAKTNPVPVPSPAKPDPRNNQFGRMEQSQENRSRAPQGPPARVGPPTRSPQPPSKNENLGKTSTNFIKRENSYSSEEEDEDEDDEDEEDSEIERLDINSK